MVNLCESFLTTTMLIDIPNIYLFISLFTDLSTYPLMGIGGYPQSLHSASKSALVIRIRQFVIHSISQNFATQLWKHHFAITLPCLKASIRIFLWVFKHHIAYLLHKPPLVRPGYLHYRVLGQLPITDSFVRPSTSVTLSSSPSTQIGNIGVEAVCLSQILSIPVSDDRLKYHYNNISIPIFSSLRVLISSLWWDLVHHVVILRTQKNSRGSPLLQKISRWSAYRWRKRTGRESRDSSVRRKS